MASKTRAKSRGSELERENFYKQFFPGAHALPGGQGPWDVLGCPWPVEDKKVNVPTFLAWFKHYMHRHGDYWIMHWTGDRRKFQGTFVMMPEPMLELLLEKAYGKIDEPQDEDQGEPASAHRGHPGGPDQV